MARLSTAGPSHPWHVPHGAGANWSVSASVHVDPQTEQLEWCGLRVHELAAGGSLSFSTGALEMCVLPLSGPLRVEVERRSFELRDRSHVFHGIADWCYLPVDAEVRIAATGGPVQFAVPSARAATRFDPVKIEAEAVPVELRGAGQSTRQINNFMAPEVFDGAHRLMCVEVLTPGGNWSSYPPHRHDGIGECTVNNEEIYYFRIGIEERPAGGDPVRYSDDGFGMHRTYTVDGEIDVNVAVYDGDLFLIPRGYHGPCAAAPGYPMYYLNVLAGSTAERTMAFCDDPAHHWVRRSWNGLPADPRLPMTSASGPATR